MINFLRILFSILFVYMVYTVISTSLQSNLFEEWSNLAQIPWLTATLVDFYVNTIIISIWAIYKEHNIVRSISWIILFVLLGSIATTFYMLTKLFKMKSSDSINTLFTKDETAVVNI